MKKLSAIIFILLFVFSFSCKQEGTKKNSDKTTSDDDSTTSETTSLSCGSASITSGSGTCSGTECNFSKTSTTVTIKVPINGSSSSVRSILVDSDSDSSMNISNTSNSSYFTLTAKTPSSKNSSYSATVYVRDLALCKKSYSSSKCDVEGKNSNPSAHNSKWDESCVITIGTNSSASTNSKLQQYIDAGCATGDTLIEGTKELCDSLKPWIDLLGLGNE